MKFRIPLLPLRVIDAYDDGREKSQRAGGFYKPGNKYSLACNMSEDSNQRRLRGLRKTWEVARLKRAGKKVVTHKMKKAARKRKRLRLKVGVAKEVREIQDMCRQRASVVIERMFDIVESTTAQESAVIAAGAVILERAYGKANQTNINATVDANGKATEVSSKELDERIAKTLKRVEDLTGGKAKAPASKNGPPDLRKRDIDTGGSSVH